MMPLGHDQKNNDGHDSHEYNMNYPMDGSGYGFGPVDATPSPSEDDESVKLFIGQIPKHLDEDALRPFFDEFGPILELTVIRDKATKLHRGCAFLTYARKQSATRAIQSLHDKVKLPNALNPLQIRPAESQAERENKIFVGMLPKTVSELDLHNMFSRYGQLKEIHIIRGPEGHSKGCAFVKFVDRDAAMLAIHEMNDTLPEGSSRPLVIKFADNKKLSRDGGDSDSVDANSTDYYQSQHQQQQQGGQQFNYPMSPSTSHHPMMPVSYMSYGSGNPHAPNPHVPPHQYMYYPSSAAFYSGSGSGPGSPMGSLAMSPPGGSMLYQLPAAQPGMGGNGSRAHREPGGAGGGGLYHGAQDLPAAPPRGGGGDRGGGRPLEGPAGANLFIYHLPRDLTDADLATLFAPFGNVISAKVYVDKKTSESKGFGFVSYDGVDAAEAAIDAMNGFQIGSKRLKVQHKRTGGGGGGGGYGGHHMPTSHSTMSSMGPGPAGHHQQHNPVALPLQHYSAQHQPMGAPYHGGSDLGAYPSMATGLHSNTGGHAAYHSQEPVPTTQYDPQHLLYYQQQNPRMLSGLPMDRRDAGAAGDRSAARVLHDNAVQQSGGSERGSPSEQHAQLLDAPTLNSMPDDSYTIAQSFEQSLRLSDP